MRVANYASNEYLLGLVNRTQQRTAQLEQQIASEQKSQTYAGIGIDTRRLVNMENTRTALDGFIRNNESMDLQLQTMDNAVEAIRTTVGDFRHAMVDFNAGATDDQEKVHLIQDTAFKALQSIEGFLNTKVDGRYLFAGGRTNVEAVDLGLTTLEDFQNTFNGASVVYPTERDVHVANVDLAHADTGDLTFDQATGTITAANLNSLANIPVGAAIRVNDSGLNDGVYTVTANTGSAITVKMERFQVTEAAPTASLSAPNDIDLGPAVTGGLNFDAAAQTVTAMTPGSLADIPVGSVFTVNGSPNNDGRYTVLTNDGDTITIESMELADEIPAPNTATLSTVSYYNGDTLSRTHRVDDSRSFAFDTTAIDPAFEKAIRAISMIAQGKHGTEGGLDQNTDRIDDAFYLINSALDRVVAGDPPFGAEEAGNIEDVQRDIGFHRDLIQETNLRHLDFIATLDKRIGDIEQIDTTEAVTKLLDQVQALEASFAALSTVRRLSLMNFM